MATTSDAMTTETAAGRPWRGDDFADWLPPMLVRELRQGIQSGVFFWTFLLIHVALPLHAAFTVLAMSGRFDGNLIRTSGGTLWAMLVILLGLVIPFRGLSAIALERTGNNLDLVRLTRLSATRIVVGKWAATVAQVALVAVSILPYLVLRYFLGGVNAVDELRALGWLVVAAAVVTAIAVQASTRPLRERLGVILLGLVGLVVLGRLGVVMRPLFSGQIGWLGLAFAAIYSTLFLEAAAATIAPASENHALRKRLLGLGCAAVVAGGGMFASRGNFAAVALWLGLPVLVIAVGSLCERPVRFRRLHAAFARSGVAGRAAAAVFTPGWATGLVFVALAGGLVAAGWFAMAGRLGVGLPFAAACVSLAAAALVFPLPLLLFLPRLEERATLYVAVQAICLVVFGLVAYGLARAPGDGAPAAAAALFPLAGLLWLIFSPSSAHTTTVLVVSLVVLTVVLAIIARPWCREMRHTQRLVADRRPTP